MPKIQIEVARYENIIKNNVKNISVVNDCINDIIRISRWILSLYSKNNVLEMKYGKRENYTEIITINVARYIYENKVAVINKIKSKNNQYFIDNNKTIIDADKILSDYDATYKVIKYIFSDYNNSNKYLEIREKYRYLSKNTFNKNIEKIIELMNISNVSKFIFSIFVYSILSVLDFKEVDRYIEKELENTENNAVEKIVIDEKDNKNIENDKKTEDYESEKSDKIEKEEAENIKKIGKKIKGLNIKEKTKKKKSKSKGILGGIFDTFKDIFSSANKSGNFLLDIINQIKAGSFNPVKSGLELLKTFGSKTVNFASKIVSGIANFFSGGKKQELEGVLGSASKDVISGISDIENKKIDIENRNTKIISTSIDNLASEAKKFTEQSQANSTTIQEQNQVRNDELKKIEATLSQKMDAYASELRKMTDVLDTRLSEFSGNMSNISGSIDSQVGVLDTRRGGRFPIEKPTGVKNMGRAGGRALGGKKSGTGIRKGFTGSVTQASKNVSQQTVTSRQAPVLATASAKVTGKPTTASQTSLKQTKQTKQQKTGQIRGGDTTKPGAKNISTTQEEQAKVSDITGVAQTQQKQDTNKKTTQPTQSTPHPPRVPETKSVATPQPPSSKKETEIPKEPEKTVKQTADIKATADVKVGEKKKGFLQRLGDKASTVVGKVKKGAGVVIDVAKQGWEYAEQLIATYLPTIMNTVYSVLKSYITFDILVRSFKANAVFGPFDPENQLFEKEKKEAEKKSLDDRLSAGAAESRAKKVSLGTIRGEGGRENLGSLIAAKQGNLAFQINTPTIKSLDSSLRISELPMTKQENLYSLKTIKYDMESRKKEIENLKNEVEKMKKDMQQIREINAQVSKDTQELAARTNQTSAFYYTFVSKQSANTAQPK